MNYRFRKSLVIHIFQGIFIYHIVHPPCAKEFKEIDPAFAVGALKPGKQFIADMGTVAVFSIMAGPGIVHVNIVREL